MKTACPAIVCHKQFVRTQSIIKKANHSTNGKCVHMMHKCVHVVADKTKEWVMRIVPTFS